MSSTVLKVRGRSAWLFAALLSLWMLAFCNLYLPAPVWAEVLCADDIVPAGMAVTATGTTVNCAGACRAREVEPVCGPVMKICAGQPIPRGYVLDSITTMPACECLGQEGNAYVIRYVGVEDKPLASSDENSPYEENQGSQDDLGASKERLRFPYGDPPFGNLLCGTSSVGPQEYGNLFQPISQRGNEPPWGGYGGSASGSFPPGSAVSNGPGLSNNAPEPWPEPAPQWNYQQNEPFRVGQ